MVFPVLHGPADRVAAVTDAMITPDGSGGLLVREAEAGKAVVFAAHAQTLNAMNSGADVYIQKPFNPDELAARLLAGRASLCAGDERDGSA